MTRTAWIGLGVIAVLLAGGLLAYRAISREVDLSGILSRGGEARIELPPGFAINEFATDLDRPRFIRFDPEGRLFVAERGAGRIVILEDADSDGVSDSQSVFAAGLDEPHSLVLHGDLWYVGVPRGVVTLEDRDGNGEAEFVDRLINDYPTRGHSTRTIEFLPDGRMVVSVGSSCNVCVDEDPRRAAIVVYDGDSEQLYATGLRNAVGLTVHPETGDLWASNNGRDRMGDDLPPDNIYQIEEGADYGFPRCHSGRIPDPEFGGEGACAGVGQPIAEIQAHSAPLGLAFYDGDTFPTEYYGDLFIAYHGSWNRSVPTGYKVVRLPFDGLTPGGDLLDFASGWLEDDLDTVTGRPVGLAVGPDGALYVSDDAGGVIYRISYQGESE